MEQTEQTENKKSAGFKDYAMLTFGTLVMIVSCLFFVGAIALDVAGEKAIGEVSNIAGDCSGTGTCWTGKVDFTTKDGEQVSFYPNTNPFLFDVDEILSGRSYKEFGNFQVRYFEAYPQIAKIKLAFFLEYTNTVCGLGIGTFILLITYASSAFGRRKPLVLDLSKLRKGNK